MWQEIFIKSRAWACEWLKRYSKEGIEGLKDRTKSGRPPKLSKETSYQIKQELKQSNQGWTTKQVEELIIKKSGINYHSIHIYRLSFENGDSNKKVTRKVHVNTASREEKNNFKKRAEQTLVVGISSSKSKQESFTIISRDESFFFYDSLIRRVWIDKREKTYCESNRLAQTFLYFWSRKYRRKSVIQTV